MYLCSAYSYHILIAKITYLPMNYNGDDNMIYIKNKNVIKATLLLCCSYYFIYSYIDHYNFLFLVVITV